MFEKKSKFTKVVGSILIAFFVIIISITFILPSTLSMSGNSNVMATYKGKKVSIVDYAKFKEMHGLRNADTNTYIRRYILNMYISDLLLQDELNAEGIIPSVEFMDEEIKNMFTVDNVYQKDRLAGYLHQINYTYDEFIKMYSYNYTKEFTNGFLGDSVALSKEEQEFNQYVEGSNFSIKYCMLSNADLRRKFKDQLNVSQAEIKEAMDSLTKEEKKENVSVQAVRAKLINKKLKVETDKLVDKLNNMRAGGATFVEMAQILGTDIRRSKTFKPGDQIVPVNGKDSLYAIENSDVFAQEFSNLKKGQASQVISSFNGIYIFSPENVKIGKAKANSEIAYQQNKARMNSLTMNMNKKIRDGVKIKLNDKFFVE